MKKFLENIGNASTTAFFDGKKLGHNVNAAAYILKDGTINVYLESNGIARYFAGKKTFANVSEFEDWKGSISENKELFLAAIESFGATTAF